MANIFSLFGSIFIDNEKANASIDKTTEKAEQSGGKVGNSFGKIAKGAAIVGTAAVGMAAAAGTAALKLATDTSASADRVDKMSQKIGMSREGFQEWDYVLSQNGVSIDSMTAGMKTLTAGMDNASKGNKKSIENFKELGLSVTDSSGKLKSQEQMFNESVTALQGMTDGTEKARLASLLFGKQGAEMMPMLNGTADSVEQLKNKANELGMVMSDDTVDSGVKFTDTMDTMKRSLGGMAAGLGGAILPLIQKVGDLIVKNIPFIQSSITKITPIITTIFEKLLPPLMDLAQEIFPVIMDLIMSLLPPLMDIVTAILPVITDLIKTLLPPIIQIVKMILPLLVSLITPLLPLLEPILALLQPLIDLLLMILTPLIDLLNMVLPPLIKIIAWLIEKALVPVQAALQIVADVIGGAVKGAFEGIKGFIEGAITVFKSIITWITNTFTGGWSGAWDAIKGIFSTVIDGIKGYINNVKEFFQGIIDFIKNTFTGAWLGAWNGIKAIFSGIMDKFQEPIDKIKSFFTSIIDFVTNVFHGKWQAAWDGIKNIFSTIFDGIKSAFKIPINWIIDGINAFIRGINKIKIPDWVPEVGGKGFHIDEFRRLKVGMEYVPYDNMPALLHRGERVLTASENRGQGSSRGGFVLNNYGTIVGIDEFSDIVSRKMAGNLALSGN